jgi:hypothetical protein
MQTQDQTVEFAYEIGEEVVARLGGAQILDVERGIELPRGCAPDWTICAVIGRVERRGRHGYVLRFRRHGDACVSVVPESAIEGVA